MEAHQIRKLLARQSAAGGGRCCTLTGNIPKFPVVIEVGKLGFRTPNSSLWPGLKGPGPRWRRGPARVSLKEESAAGTRERSTQRQPRPAGGGVEELVHCAAKRRCLPGVGHHVREGAAGAGGRGAGVESGGGSAGRSPCRSDPANVRNSVARTRQTCATPPLGPGERAKTPTRPPSDSSEGKKKSNS